MNKGEKHSYSSARSHKNISHMGYPLLQMSRHSSHGCFTRSSHGGRSKTTRQSQFFCYGGLQESHHRRSYMYYKVDPKAFSHGSPNAFLHSGHWKTSYRCKAIPVFKPSPVSHGYNEYCHNNCLRNSRVYDKHNNYNPFEFNQTKTMRHLNERLSCYVEKVNFLEQHNESFEKKIAKWYENNAPSMPADRSQYLEEIQKLQNQTSKVFTNNVGIIRNIDNARLAIDDYNNKYEMELNLRSSIDADSVGLRSILEGFIDQSVKLESEVDKLQQEMLKMRRDSEQEINSLTSQFGIRVSVEVEASPSADLNKALSGIREEYEKLSENNLRELEKHFQQRSKKLNQEVSSGFEQLQSADTECIDVKHSLQTMAIELQSEHYMISTLEDTLQEKQTYYVSELALLQQVINNVESQLDQIVSQLQSQNEEYRLLMDKKTHLEQEITTYQSLLDGNGIDVTGHPPSTKHIGM
ncbi:keratin, type I cytoskeletal 19-like [Rana temporaria]|uniref:keratin, type I cytoskeletal 19-like n=1 Tax=Rana temporaria TaxID=8407 RepID=UPI001AAD8DE3|nr:keratin, type I cytoskeletal 19-like [Rana temporaria]